MDDDDPPVGRILNRREALELVTAAGAVMLTGCRDGGARSPSRSTCRTQKGPEDRMGGPGGPGGRPPGPPPDGRPPPRRPG